MHCYNVAQNAHVCLIYTPLFRTILPRLMAYFIFCVSPKIYL